MAKPLHFTSPQHPEFGDVDWTHSTSKSGNQFRRSISIFSRRGTDTPEPTPAFLIQAAMRQPKCLSPRQKSWIGRRKSISGSPDSPKVNAPMTPRGTILHSVPPAKTIQMTALEEEMPTSPNEEIVSAISEDVPTLHPLNGSRSASASLYRNNTKSRSTTSLSQRRKSTMRKETNTRIGEWRDGIVYWDEGVFEGAQVHHECTAESTGLAPVQPTRPAPQMPPQLLAVKKPNLSVIIPGPHPSRNSEQTVPSILQPRPHRPFRSVSTSSIVSEQPQLSTGGSFLPLETEHDLELPIMKPPRRAQGPRYSVNTSSSGSRSSTASSLANSGETVPSSRSSSATSFDTVPATVMANKNKELPPLPWQDDEASMPITYLPYRPSMSVRLPTTSTFLDSVQRMRTSKSLYALDTYDRDFLHSSPYNAGVPTPSPTLSQAEQDLQDHLSTMPEDERVAKAIRRARAGSAFGRHGVRSEVCNSSVTSDEDSDARAPSPAPSRAPTIPRRSRKREWHVSKTTKLTAQLLSRRRSESQLKQTEPAETTTNLRKAVSVFQSSRVSADFPFLVTSGPSNLDARSSLSSGIFDEGAAASSKEHPSRQQGTKVAKQGPSYSAAENVLLGILSALKTTDDLFNTAMISKGMYRVYKANEMELIRQVTFNQSPPAWELREWSTPARNQVGSSKASSQLEHTPTSYMRCHRRDTAVIERLKRLILDKCQTFIRRETAFALSTPTHPNASRFNDAFWRIWCFCEIFGSSRGREDDITGQMDWLKGGLLANNQDCAATVNTNLDFDMTSVLLNAPHQFASANIAGLSATQLFDMTELWTCMTVLLQGYHGLVNQARQHGIFDETDVVEGDLEKEEQILEEWTHYLLTLGPVAILEMAELASDNSSAGFALAEINGWTTWTLPIYNGSRCNFLKEPVAKSFQEQIAVAKQKLQDPLEEEKKERSRQRVASLAAEIRIRRQSSAYKRLPLIDMKAERAMSVMSRRTSTASSRSTRSDATRSNSRRTSGGVPFTPLSPTSLWSCPRSMSTISPIIEERLDHFGRADSCSSEDTTTRAVQKIVAMGFPPDKVREALRTTDMGDGIQIDRAVNWLLRSL